ncbi:ubiquitin-protein transferase activating protein CDC20 [Sugiyamaella lignohabitans]|uniref:Ubiquitin-protein transferase activating protein CDC20 n=1 Tax=Sugiyamaella lignohabitans TaxID=796027 RepID=A0A167FDJ6_9ASCO|nr:ubiquitin-protein transferase activating protein CDC20 [Sugiyamaella lignohabitans]ANB15163.1 ubiquitin-protein transferase activating protein CDC20 [Sugiyamaella lignohabitans]
MSTFSTPSRPVRRTLFFNSPNVPKQPRLDSAGTSSTLSFPSFPSMTTTPRKHATKSIGKPNSPLRNDVALSDWALTSSALGSVNSTPGKITKKEKALRASAKVDRFIPNRQTSNTSISKLEASESSNTSTASSDTATDSTQSVCESLQYRTSVAEACGIALNTRILEFQPAAPQSSKPVDLRSQYNRPLRPAANAQARRKVPTGPERVLDAPGLIDDYYLNLLDWSCGNQVAVALEQTVYIWSASTGSVSSLMDSTNGTYVSSVRWSGDGAYLSVGLSDGDVQIWDVEDQTKLRSMSGHSARVGVLSWDKHMLSSGCRDGSIWNHDVRVAQHKVSEFNNHAAEVCGLEWRADGAQLASGGNDNVVNIWDARSSTPKFTKTNHKAAVKALAWCPWQTNLLASGGGSQDKHIHFWNSTTGARVNSIDTGSQVTSLRWSSLYKEIVSSHGFPNNYLSIWSYPTLTKNVDIQAHDSRVLHTALSPDGQTLATCASDENLKFWKIFESMGRKVASAGSTLASGKDMAKTMMIR